MPKEFYTERDIEDMVKRGVMSLQVTDNVVLTELAFEKAARLGMQLLRDGPVEPPAAPVRPYISLAGITAEKGASATKVSEGQADLTRRIRETVNARLGTQVDPALLDIIIQRVLSTSGVK
jgi:hypothetical protein